MAKRVLKTVLFLGPGNDDRSPLAERQFNAVAGKFGLPWQALARGLPGTGTGNPPLIVATADEFQAADRLICWKSSEPELLTTLQDPLAARADPVEFWDIPATKNAATQIEPAVASLIARILGGGQARENTTTTAPTPGQQTQPIAKPVTVKVGRETAGRGGKWVTTVFEVPLNSDQLKDLGATLKQRCGTGGTVKDGRIEIQGDQRERVIAELEKLGYKVKRVGG